MNASWWDLVPAVLFTALTITVPGALIAWAGRARGRMMLLAAPPLSFTVISTAAVLAPRFSVKWGFLPVAAVTVILGLFAVLLRFLPRDRQDAWEGKARWFAGAIAIGGVFHIARLMWALQDPDAISQTYDSPFHHNLVKLMVERGDASFLHVNLVTPGTENGLYPALWHEILSLYVGISGATTPIATNGFLIVVTTLLWPLGIGMLTGWGLRSWRAAGAGALLATIAPQMPHHFTWFGVLYPNLLAYAIIPALLTFFIPIFFSRRGKEGSARALAFFLLSLPGLIVAHPSAFFAFLVLSIAPVVSGFWLAGRRLVSKKGVQQYIVGSVFAAIAVGFYVLINSLTFRVEGLASMRLIPGPWGPIGGIVGGTIRGFTYTAGWDFRDNGPLPFLLGAVAFVGIGVALRSQRTSWIPFAHLAAVFLYLVSYAMEHPFRTYVVGLWYGDIQRLVALVGVTAVPLLGLGSYGIARFIRQRVRLPIADQPEWRIVAVVSAFVFIFGQLNPALHKAYVRIAENMAFDTPYENIGMLSRDEKTLIERLPETVPEDSTILGNPWDGSSFTWALSDRYFAFPHVAPVYDEDAMYVARNLNNALTDPEVCELVNDRHFTHVLEFGDDYLWGGDHSLQHERFPGLDGIEKLGIAKVVDSEGKAQLLEITACFSER